MSTRTKKAVNHKQTSRSAVADSPDRAAGTRMARAPAASRGEMHHGTGSRNSHAMDEAVQTALLTRLRRVEGQVRGVHGMVADKRYCADILVQLSAIQEALRGVSRELLRNHLAHCATHELTRGGSHATAMVDELVDLMHKHNR